VLIAILMVCLLAVSGDGSWPEAWCVIILMLLSSLIPRFIAARRHPEWLEERTHFTGHTGYAAWDRFLSPAVALLGPIATWITAGLDRGFGWTGAVPIA